MGNPADEVPMVRLSYNDVHNAIKATAPKIREEFAPTLFIAIGGGGFIPARILRTFLKVDDSGKKRNIPIQAVGLVLYESMGGLGTDLNQGGLLGRKILVVDEVDDTRTTLEYTIKELERDIEAQLAAVKDEKERERLKAETKLGIFVVHNKLKPKTGTLPSYVKYFSAVDTPDVWLAYPWECDGSIEEHDALRSTNYKAPSPSEDAAVPTAAAAAVAVDATVKGLPPPPTKYDGSPYRIGIVHARWNDSVISALVKGTVAKLKEQGVKEENIVVKSVPGSYELPFAAQKLIEGGKVSAANAAPSLLASTTNLLSLDSPSTPKPTAQASGSPTRPFDAIIAIGCLIKGSTMHFEYICDAVSHGLMKVQLDSGTPVVFGVLTALTDEQALQRAGIGRETKGHNHGEDWALAAVEQSVLSSEWSEGKL